MHYYVGITAVPITFARNELGLDAYLVCPGPSLGLLSPDDYDRIFARRGIYVMAINTAYPHVRRPHAWVGLDQPVCYDQRLYWEAFPKFTDRKLACYEVGGSQIRHCPMTYFMEVAKEDSNANMMFLDRDHTATFGHTRGTMIVALHLLVWMGARRIHLVGCDLDVGRGAYHDARAIGQKAVQHNAEIMRDLAYTLRQLAILGGEHGIEIVSCTEGSPVNSHMDWLPLDDAVELSARRVPIERLERCRKVAAWDLEGCRWRGRVMGKEGIVVAADAHEQWLLPWWMEQYREHNDRPVCIVDMGMTEDARAWAEANADEVREVLTESGRFDIDRMAVLNPAKALGRAWFYKPSCILLSPWERTFWSDLDVEIRGSLDEHFALLEEGQLVGQAESLIFRVRCTTGTMMNVGLLGVVRGDPIIERWARYCYTRHAEYYGDQDILNYLMAQEGRVPTYLPYGLCGLRAEGEAPDATAFHWTGGEGKRHIWDQIVLDMRRQYNLWWPPGETRQHEPRPNPEDNPHRLPLQDRREWFKFLEMLRRAYVWPRVVELGVYEGCQERYYGLVNARCHVGVDIEEGVADVVGDSGKGSTVMAARQMLPDGECDVLFIDGDHHQALRDHRLWAGLVRPGGMIAWHDLNLDYVRGQWKIAQQDGWESWEIAQSRQHLGIGIMRKPGTHIPSRDREKPEPWLQE